jgi:hypothetical protein
VSEYTKGPWRKLVSEDGFISIGHDQTINLGPVLGFRETLADVWSDGDANLIAAAPELLEALKGVVDEMELADFDPEDTDTWYGRAIALIAKAEGR